MPVDKVSVVYNWCDENAMSMTEYCPFKLPESGFNLVFAGNMGQAQGLETIIEAARISSDQKIDANFILVGDGVSKSDAQDLASRYSLSNVYFIPRVPMNQVGELLRCSDALLVHLRDDDLFRITIPSRTQAYLFTGKPILMAVQGDASELIKISKSGVCCNSDDPEGMAAALKALVDLPKSTSQQFGINGRSYYENNLSMTKGVSRFIDIFSKVIK